MTWTAVDAEGNSAEPKEQKILIAVGYSGSLLSEDKTFENVAESDFYHVYDLNGDNLQIMRLSISDDLGSENADLSTIDAWLADNTSWTYATDAQLASLGFFFEQDTGEFASFNNGWGEGEQWNAFGKNGAGELVSLLVDTVGFGVVTSATGMDTNATDAAVLLVRVFIDSDNDGIHDADDAFPNDASADMDDDGLTRTS